jgi:acyl carrier protein
MAVAAVFFVVSLSIGGLVHVLREAPADSQQAPPARTPQSTAQQTDSAPPQAHTPKPAAPAPEGSPKRVATTADEITALIAEHLQVARADVKPDKDLVLDLGADPLDKTEIVMAIETSYDIQISDKDARKLKSVGDFINYVERKERAATQAKSQAAGQVGVIVQGNGNGTAVGQGNSVQVNPPNKDAGK